MIMADVWKIVFLVLATQAVLVSWWLLAAALFPVTLRRTRAAYDTRSGRLTLLGLAVTLPSVLLGLSLLQTGPHPLLKLLGAMLTAAPVALGLSGSAGFCERIGAGLPSAADGRQPWRRVLRGGVVLSFAFLLPVIGWFVLLPWTLVSGVGATLGAARVVRRPRPVSTVDAADRDAPVHEAEAEPVG